MGPIAQNTEGKLVVYPGAVLHLECLWLRKYGDPTWEVTHSFRKYPQGNGIKIEFVISIRYHLLVIA